MSRSFNLVNVKACRANFFLGKLCASGITLLSSTAI